MALTIDHKEHDQRPVLVLTGELDLNTAPQLSKLALSVAESGARDIIIDAAALESCDATGLSAFVQIAARLRTRAGRLAIVSPNPGLSQAMADKGLLDGFVVAGSVAGALYAIHRDHP
jgi:anti-anti-sigma factor